MLGAVSLLAIAGDEALRGVVREFGIQLSPQSTNANDADFVHIRAAEPLLVRKIPDPRFSSRLPRIASGGCLVDHRVLRTYLATLRRSDHSRPKGEVIPVQDGRVSQTVPSRTKNNN